MNVQHRKIVTGVSTVVALIVFAIALLPGPVQVIATATAAVSATVWACTRVGARVVAGWRYSRETDRLGPLCRAFLVEHGRAPSDTELAVIAAVRGEPSPVGSHVVPFTVAADRARAA